MNAQTERFSLAGPAGAIEALRDSPAAGATVRGTAVIAHPHPLFGGTMDNKVVQTMARAFVQCGWVALRFNFRGVGASAGTHDEGRGEVDDLLAVVQGAAASGPLALAGFSFGAFVTCGALARLVPQREVASLVLVGTAASRFSVPALPAQVLERALVVHGETDDTVPLAAVMDWARPQSLPVTVVPGGGHFFHGQLPLLKNLVVRHLCS
ncbi:MAG: alpha/beta hydrolase [Ramlibacter sp.]